MSERLGASIPQSIGAEDTLEPQMLAQKSEKGVIALARRGKRGRKH